MLNQLLVEPPSSTVQFHGWFYETLPLDCDPSVVDDFEEILKIWRSRYRDGRVPSWSDFSFEDFGPWMGRLNLLDIISQAPLRIRYRLWGTRFADVLGYDLSWTEVSPDEYGFDQEDFDFLAGLIADRRIGLWGGPVFWQKRDYLTLSLISLPLASDGKTVDRILTACSCRGDSLYRSVFAR